MPVPKDTVQQIHRVFLLVTLLKTPADMSAAVGYMRRTEFRPDMRSLFLVLAAQHKDATISMHSAEWRMFVNEELRAPHNQPLKDTHNG